MYEVKEYNNGDKDFYGVYIKTEGNSYGREALDEDNIVVLCFSEIIANKVKDLLEEDHLIEENMNK